MLQIDKLILTMYKLMHIDFLMRNSEQVKHIDVKCVSSSNIETFTPGSLVNNILYIKYRTHKTYE